MARKYQKLPATFPNFTEARFVMQYVQPNITRRKILTVLISNLAWRILGYYGFQGHSQQTYENTLVRFLKKKDCRALLGIQFRSNDWLFNVLHRVQYFSCIIETVPIPMGHNPLHEEMNLLAIGPFKNILNQAFRKKNILFFVCLCRVTAHVSDVSRGPLVFIYNKHCYYL